MKKLLLIFTLSALCASATYAQWTPVTVNGISSYYNNSSYIGIGTTTPQTFLHIKHPWGGDVYQMTIENPVGGLRAGMQILGQNANLQIGIYNSGNGIGSSLQNKAGLLSTTDLVLVGGANNWAGGTNGVILSPGGFNNEIARFTGPGLGIGTTTPTTNLSVKGNMSANQTGLFAVADFYTPIPYDRARITIGKTSFGNGFSSALTFYGYNSAGTTLENKWEIGTDLFTNATNNFYLWNTKISEAQLFLHDSGNVGILTTDPISNFQVQDGCTKASIGEADGSGLKYGTSYIGFNAARSVTSTGTGTWTISSDNGTPDGSGGSDGGGVIYSSIFGDMYFSIIPTLSPGYGQLVRNLQDADVANGIALKISHTNGAVYAKQIFVQTNLFADYVFNKDYALMPLSQVKSYIDQNHHLPDMPTEKEVVKDGLNVGEMNVLLTKKVEELTLYAIEQNKQIQEQKDSLAKQAQEQKDLIAKQAQEQKETLAKQAEMIKNLQLQLDALAKQIKK